MRAFDASRMCGAQGRRCTAEPPTCNHAAGDHHCRMGLGFGTDHPGRGNCKFHGGASPNGRKHAQTETAEAAVAKLGLPAGTGDPFALLEKAVRFAEGYLEASAQLLVDVVEKRNTAVALEAAAAIHVRAIRQAATTGNQAVAADVAERLAVLDERAAGLLMRFVGELLERAVPATKRAAIEAWASQRLGELAAEYERPGAVH